MSIFRAKTSTSTTETEPVKSDARRLTRAYMKWSDAGVKSDVRRTTRAFVRWSDAGIKSGVRPLAG